MSEIPNMLQNEEGSDNQEDFEEMETAENNFNSSEDGDKAQNNDLECIINRFHLHKFRATFKSIKFNN